MLQCVGESLGEVWMMIGGEMVAAGGLDGFVWVCVVVYVGGWVQVGASR
jgi:hypothetical protein